MIEASIVEDSVAPHGVRITSFILKYPRFIHSEIMTHRTFSRNAASSRAIPFKKMIELVTNETAMPEHWGAEQKGMQSGDEVTERDIARDRWEYARDDAIHNALLLHQLGVHKSICNRLLEPFAHMTVLVTATDFENFFALRAHKDAMPEFRILATQMLDLYITNVPKRLAYGQWHTPLGRDIPPEYHDDALLIATGRCARISYLNHNGVRDPKDDIALAERLSSSGHWSPFEHCAIAHAGPNIYHGNFRGWKQLRKFYPDENRTMSLQDMRDRLNEMKLIEQQAD